MKNNINKLLAIALLSFIAISCGDFLDELPDNRTEIDNNNKIRKILVSAYPSTSYGMLAELSSDNIDDYGLDNPNTDLFLEQVSYWKEITETNNDGPASLWGSCYNAIANANQALASIENSSNPASLAAEKGEALIARAYSHFILVNMFSKHYSTKSSNTDLGIPYLEAPETTLNPKYKRGTVKEVYQKINKDIEEGLPLISDNIYTVPKYHFNVKASYAFAARFNLYYENWAKAKKYASVVVTANPSSVLRDWKALSKVVKKQDPITKAYYEDPSALFTQAYSSSAGRHFGGFFRGSRFNHTSAIANRETLSVALPWADNASLFPYNKPVVYETTNLDKTLFMKLPSLFETKDAVAQTGYLKTVRTPFTTDETLLVRAEANVMLKQYDAALADLNSFTMNYNQQQPTTNIEQVNTFYNAVPYSTEATATQKKKLTASFIVTAGTQENMLHYTLQLRRILTMHDGLRWFDNKRYGIVVPRYLNGKNGAISVADVLTANDNRKALQLPKDVITAGLTPNPR
ncbi:RagB/SusD family nutrient uptake outer membrane protein [Tenacibaculum finnmarkense]|uniref:RagB/SusD family nutrient uptake outer membrane protein n=1 Tax=Tenacibaculum finnmarkense TaxID=2781243 RepID=UPI001E483942|nr:RagB/SusD family nutrient uptake outer membrane protein [Tenacibaculum finnmarkense]MCD8416659.1 RagB/SusD family nutrient uptake outer membrane protein [Tenacibaculum finnmarkense genomovar finnmarkense]